MFKIIKLYPKQTIDPEKLFNRLVELGYKRSREVSLKGEFSHRGEVIDIYPCNYEYPARIELEFDAIRRIFTFALNTGKLQSEQNPLVILPARSGTLKFRLEDISLNKFETLEKNDYVVHIDHGIGKYLGAGSIKGKPHICLEYDGGDRLYVPWKDKHLIQKYIGFSGHAPRLHTLGSTRWQNTKLKTQQGIASYAKELLKVQAKRASLSGFAFSPDTDWQKQFEARFPYQPTPDQGKASQEAKKDMESPKPMDRLLCGDVGYGKTEVAFRAAFKAVMDHKQVAMLVPTTILAEQHYHNLVERVKDFPVNVQMLSRFKTQTEQLAIVKDLATGGVDIVFGTHRLLSADIMFKDLGLVIIDEEQRFGVRAKEKLKHVRELVDVLTLTATPIPRTLYMSLLGVKDMSTINTAPEQRLPVETFVCPTDDEILRNAILTELERNGQIYAIHNRIHDIEPFAERLQALVPEARIAVGHGRMPEHELEKVMLQFIDHRIDMLVSTTIVESGLDIPNANTLIVDQADQFGLADLYQLRGRVGRFTRKAYAYFLIPKAATFNPEAQRRLLSIQKFTELGSGFKIAMEDLEIRGAGNILGEEQHGYILAVGFDLYCQLLNRTIQGLKAGLNTRPAART